MRTVLSITALACSATVARAQPDPRGPHAVDRWDAGRVDIGGASIPVAVHHPIDAPSPGPVVAVIHGFARNGSFHVELADVLATRGYVAVVPDLPCGPLGCAHEENGRRIGALLQWAVDRAAEAETPIAGRVDESRRGVIGHSAGGLAVFLAASYDPSIDVVVGFDPVDFAQRAEAIAPALSAPSLHLIAEVQGACNADWSSRVFPLVPAPAMRFRIRRSGHCDVEDPSDALCPTVCGRGDRSTTPLFRFYAVAWVGCVLEGDPAWAPHVNGSALDEDLQNGVIDTLAMRGLENLPCTRSPAQDAGAPDAAADAGAPLPHADASAFDAAAGPQGDVGILDTGSLGSADASQVDATRSDASGLSTPSRGCRCTTPRDRSTMAFLLLFIPVLTLRRLR